MSKKPILMIHGGAWAMPDEGIAAHDSQTGIVTPMIRISDLVFDRGQFGEGGLLGGKCHPIQLLNVGLECALQFMNEF